MYVDESGDTGLTGSPTRYFTLTGVVLHELSWQEYLDRLVAFRQRMRHSFGLLMREEIHSAHFITCTMLRFNPVPNQPQHGAGYRNIQIPNLIEDPYFKDSRDSYFVQAADLAAFLIYQKLAQNSFIKRKSASNYFDRLQPVLCTVAATGDSYGIVRL